MKILGIMGSPRVGGNSDILLDEALVGAKDAGSVLPHCRCAQLRKLLIEF